MSQQPVVQRGRLEGPLAGAMALAAASLEAQFNTRQFKHYGSAGQAHECLLSSILRKFLPTRWGIGSGEIVSADGGRSQQIDLIVYDALNTTLIKAPDDAGRDIVVPVEGVHAVIEVTGNLDSRKLRTDAVKVAGVKALPRGDFIMPLWYPLSAQPASPSPIRAYSFGFDGVKVQALSCTMKQLDVTIENHFDNVFVVNKGFVTNAARVRLENGQRGFMLCPYPDPVSRTTRYPVAKHSPGETLAWLWHFLGDELARAYTGPFSLQQYE